MFRVVTKLAILYDSGR